MAYLLQGTNKVPFNFLDNEQSAQIFLVIVALIVVTGLTALLASDKI